MQQLRKQKTTEEGPTEEEGRIRGLQRGLRLEAGALGAAVESGRNLQSRVAPPPPLCEGTADGIDVAGGDDDLPLAVATPPKAPRQRWTTRPGDSH